MSPVLTLAQGFELDANKNLRFTGPDNSNVMIKTKFGFGALQPSQVDPHPLDQGPRGEVYVYVQVGDRKGVTVRLDETVYFDPNEWPVVRYTLDLEDIFTINTGETVRCFAYYVWVQPPVAPVNPNNFYLTILAANLSFIALSTDHESGGSFPLPQIEELKVNPPLYTQSQIYSYTPGVTGLRLINIRLNISEIVIYDSTRNQTSQGIGTAFNAFLSLNGGGAQAVQTLQTITNQPNIIVGNTMWPTHLDLYLLANLQPTDSVTVMVFINFVVAVDPSNPPFFNFVPAGSCPMTVQFVSSTNVALNPRVQTFPEYNKTINLGVDGKSQEFPVEGALVSLKETGAIRFALQDSQLTFTGNSPRWVKVRANLIIAQILLHNSDHDPAFVVDQNLGFAIGVNGATVNSVQDVNRTYSDIEVLHKWMATQSAENFILLNPGDRLSFLLWTNSIGYLNTPTNPLVVLPVHTPAAGSTVMLTGKLTVILETP
jgi:hypothetical protein